MCDSEHACVCLVASLLCLAPQVLALQGLSIRKKKHVRCVLCCWEKQGDSSPGMLTGGIPAVCSMWGFPDCPLCFVFLQLVTSPVSHVQGRVHRVAQAAGLPGCCWRGAASPSAPRATLTRKGVVQVSMQRAGAEPLCHCLSSLSSQTL
jgi:hypothetical protein